MLELISPSGLEDLFRRMGRADPPPTPEEIVELGASYGCDVDPEGTGPIIERHGLRF